MSKINRRDFIKMLGAGTAIGSSSFFSSSIYGKAQPHVVIIGGGSGGATAAKYLKLADRDIKVTIIEREKQYMRCYGSNEVLTGEVSLKDLTISFDTLKEKYGINFVFDSVTNVDPDKRQVILKNGSTIDYDRLIVSPGVKLIYNAIEGHTEEAANTKIPHAYKPGANQLLMKDQLNAMPDDGTIVIVAPPNPYRCPPAPYERAGLIAEWTHVHKHKPKAKIIILDPKDKFTKDQPFMLAWNRLFDFNIPESHMHNMPEDVVKHKNSLFEWIPGSEGGMVEKVDVSNMTVETSGLEKIKADVINIIPAMKAGELAFTMGLTNTSGWCETDRKTHESTVHKNIHVIGDSCVADDMPKSGYAANTQAKVCAAQIVQLLREKPLVEPMWSNVCFSRTAENYGVSIADTFRLVDGKIRKKKGTGGVSSLYPKGLSAITQMEAFYQESWIRAFVKDVYS